MNKLEDGVIKYEVQFERYKNGRADDVVALLDRADAEIAKFIKKTKCVYTKARYREIASKLREISRELKNDVAEGTDIDGVIDYELKKQKKLLDSVKGDIVKVRGGEVNFLYPTREQVKTAAFFRPAADALTYQSYLDGIEAGLFNTWDSAVRTGYLTGMPTNQIVSNVMGGIYPETKIRNPGAINALRNSVYGNTRTLLQSFAAETRNRVYEENERYFGDGESDYKYEYLATLDNRTCVICGSCGGRLYKKLSDVPSIPQHRGCRCTVIPFFDIEGDYMASKDGYVKNITFDDWLKGQDEKTQLDVLGRARYEMYKKGTPINQFVDNGKVLTLKELNESIEKSTPVMKTE